jgi:hypothetical protein
LVRSAISRSLSTLSYEAGGSGAAFSTDAGETWQPADEGRDRHYAWSVTCRR